MKKICILLMSIALLLTLSLTVFAAEDTLKIHTATAKKGETVYVTVELTESVVGNAMAVMYSCNDKHLKPVSTSCSWAKTGMLQDFDRQDTIGVWACAESIDLKGGVCILAFDVKTFARFTETEISCTISVKNGSETVGEFTATGKVVLDCEHSYGPWQDGGDLGHYRKCSLCDGNQTQSHQWNDGDLLPESETPHQQTILYTCQVCGGTKTQVKDTGSQLFPTEKEPEETTGPVTQWNPTEQETTPEHQHTEPTQQGNTQAPPLQDPTQPTTPEQDPHDHQEQPNQQEQDEHAGHDHSQEGTIPQDVLDELLQQEKDEHAGHDHSQENNTNRPATGIAVLVVLAALIGGMVFLVKKKL